MKKVLIVEREKEIADFFSGIVHSMNEHVQIYVSDDYKRAYRISMEEQIELFFVNTVLDRKEESGEVPGFRFVERIRETEIYGFTPIIITCGPKEKENFWFHEFHCYACLEQPYDRERLDKIIWKAMKYQRRKERPSYLIVRRGCVFYPLKQSEIIYIRHRRREMEVRTVREIFAVPYHTVAETVKKLDDNFVLCTRGTLVNRHYIKSVDTVNMVIHLKEKAGTLELGRTYKQNFLEWLRR